MRAMKRADIFEFYRRLADLNPSPETELQYGNTYQLLVAVVLSGQATYVGVIKAPRRLFAFYLLPVSLAGLAFTLYAYGWPIPVAGCAVLVGIAIGVLLRERIKCFPQVVVLHRLFGRGAPAIFFPAVDPLADTLLHVFRIGMQLHGATAL